MPINMQIEYPKLELENQKLKRLLHDLTPGGSEFYNDPEYCAKWIRESRQENHYNLTKIIKEKKEENEKLKEHKIELLKLLKWISRVTNNPEIGERCDKATSKYKQYN